MTDAPDYVDLVGGLTLPAYRMTPRNPYLLALDGTRHVIDLLAEHVSPADREQFRHDATRNPGLYLWQLDRDNRRRIPADLRALADHARRLEQERDRHALAEETRTRTTNRPGLDTHTAHETRARRRGRDDWTTVANRLFDGDHTAAQAWVNRYQPT